MSNGSTYTQDLTQSGLPLFSNRAPTEIGLVKLSQAPEMIFSSLLSLLPQALLRLLGCGSVMSKTSFHKITFKQKSFTRALYSLSKTWHIKVPVHVTHFPNLHLCSCSAKQAFLTRGRGQLFRNLAQAHSTVKGEGDFRPIFKILTVIVEVYIHPLGQFIQKLLR